MLAAAFGVLLGLPIASTVIPPVRIVVQGGTPVGAFKAGEVIPAAAHAGVEITPEAVGSAGPSLPSVLLTGWLGGMALFLLPVAMGLWQVHGLHRSGLPWRQGQVVADRLNGVRVQVRLHDAVPGPMTCGRVRPAIVLPRDAQTWSTEELNRAMVHGTRAAGGLGEPLHGATTDGGLGGTNKNAIRTTPSRSSNTRSPTTCQRRNRSTWHSRSRTAQLSRMSMGME